MFDSFFKTNTFRDSQFSTTASLESNETDQTFEEKVRIGKQHVLKGDVFQLVLSRAFEQEYSGDDFEVYRQLRALNPSPYMFYFDLDKAKLIGASPEAQLKITDGIAEIHPIAGTIKRSGDNQKDLKAIQTLSEDPKENAEHTMLVDLARNDLNISCKDVKVADLKTMQSFSHVIHMVSKVVGEVPKGNEFYSLRVKLCNYQNDNYDRCQMAGLIQKLIKTIQ